MSSSPKSLARMIVSLTRTVQGLSRTQQFSRSTITTAQGETRTVGDVLDEATETAGTVEGHNEDLSYLDETTWDALDDIAGQYDFGERQSDAHFEQWDSTVYAMELSTQLEETLQESEEQRLADKQAVEEELAAARRELESAEARIADARQRLEATEQTVSGMDTRITNAVNEAADAQVKAVLAQGLLTVETRAPVAADGQGKKVGAVWMHRTGAALTTLYEWTALGWVPRPLSEQIIPQVAIGSGTYGLMSGERLEARSVTAEKALIGSGANLMPDPRMADAAGWENSQWYQADGGKDGGGSLRILAAAAQRGAYTGRTAARMKWCPQVVAGGTYAVRADFRTSVAFTAAGRLSIYVRWYTEAGVEITPLSSSSNPAGSYPTGTWHTLSGEFTAPEGAARMSVGFFSNSSHNAEIVFSTPVVRPMGTGELIVDGSIQSRHTATGFLEALVANISQAFIRTGHIIDLDVSKLVATNATISQAVVEKLFADVVVAKLLTVTEKIITRDIIADNAITARTLMAGAIDGMTITGALLRTAPSGRRIQLDVNGLRAFNSDGRETARLMSEANGLEIYSPRGAGIASIGEMPMPGSSSGSTQQVNVSQPNSAGINSIVDISANSAGGAHVFVAGGSGGRASLSAGTNGRSHLLVDDITASGYISNKGVARAVWAGTASKRKVAAGGVTNVAFTFPSGFFTAVPVVVASAWGDARDTSVNVDNISRNGFTLRLGSMSVVDRTLGGQCIATQM